MVTLLHRALLLLSLSALLSGCAVVAVADTAVSVGVGAVGLAADAAIGTARIAGKAVGATAEEVLGKPFWEAPWWTVSAGLQERLRGLIAEAAQGAFVRTEVVHYGGGGRELITVDL